MPAHHRLYNRHTKIYMPVLLPPGNDEKNGAKYCIYNVPDDLADAVTDHESHSLSPSFIPTFLDHLVQGQLLF